MVLRNGSGTVGPGARGACHRACRRRLRGCSIGSGDDSNPDLNKMIASARARAARTPAQIADGLTRMVHQAPDDRLERLMKSPARRVILEGVFWQMPSRLDRGAPPG